MPTKGSAELKDGVFYINGDEVKGISDYGPVDIQEIDINKIVKFIQCPGECSLSYTMKFDVEKFWKHVGLWKWVYDNCPNRRVRHLLMYGKTKKIRIKNFRRGIRIIGNILEK